MSCPIFLRFNACNLHCGGRCKEEEWGLPGSAGTTGPRAVFTYASATKQWPTPFMPSSRRGAVAHQRLSVPQRATVQELAQVLELARAQELAQARVLGRAADNSRPIMRRMM